MADLRQLTIYTKIERENEGNLFRRIDVVSTKSQRFPAGILDEVSNENTRPVLRQRFSFGSLILANHMS
jgi:hypothetical protein